MHPTWEATHNCTTPTLLAKPSLTLHAFLDPFLSQDENADAKMVKLAGRGRVALRQGPWSDRCDAPIPCSKTCTCMYSDIDILICRPTLKSSKLQRGDEKGTSSM